MVNVNIPSKLPLIFVRMSPPSRPRGFKAIVRQWPCTWRSSSLTGGLISVKKQNLVKVENMVLIFQTCIRISLLASKKKLKKIFQLGIHVFDNSAENSKDQWNHVTVESLDCGRTRTIKWFSLFRSYRWNLSWNVIGQEEPVRKYLSEMGCYMEDLDRYS